MRAIQYVSNYEKHTVKFTKNVEYFSSPFYFQIFLNHNAPLTSEGSGNWNVTGSLSLERRKSCLNICPPRFLVLPNIVLYQDKKDRNRKWNNWSRTASQWSRGAAVFWLLFLQLSVFASALKRIIESSENTNRKPQPKKLQHNVASGRIVQDLSVFPEHLRVSLTLSTMIQFSLRELPSVEEKHIGKVTKLHTLQHYCDLWQWGDPGRCLIPVCWQKGPDTNMRVQLKGSSDFIPATPELPFWAEMYKIAHEEDWELGPSESEAPIPFCISDWVLVRSLDLNLKFDSKKQFWQNLGKGSLRGERPPQSCLGCLLDLYPRYNYTRPQHRKCRSIPGRQLQCVVTIITWQ